jgi:hypothetical protein
MSTTGGRLDEIIHLDHDELVTMVGGLGHTG